MTHYLVITLFFIRLNNAAGTPLFKNPGITPKTAKLSRQHLVWLPVLPYSSVRRLRGALLRQSSFHPHLRSAPYRPPSLLFTASKAFR